MFRKPHLTSSFAKTISGDYITPILYLICILFESIKNWVELLSKSYCHDCHGIVESSLGRGVIELGKARGFGEVGGSGLGIDASLPSFGSHVSGVILRAAINHYMGNIAELQWDLAETEVLAKIAMSKLDWCVALRRPVGRLIKASGLGLTRGILPTKSLSPKLFRLGPCLVG